MSLQITCCLFLLYYSLGLYRHFEIPCRDRHLTIYFVPESKEHKCVIKQFLYYTKRALGALGLI